MKLYSNIDYKELEIKIYDESDEWDGYETINVEAWQIANDEVKYYLGMLIFPKKIINKEEILDKLEKEFNGISFTDEVSMNMETYTNVSYKVEETIDWLNSLVLMQELVGDI